MVAAPAHAGRKLRRDVGFFGLLFISFGSIIGAGWLFGALYASSLAGPAAVISWVIGGGAVMLLALTHAELGGMYPVAGGSARFPRFAFGSLIGFTTGVFSAGYIGHELEAGHLRPGFLRFYHAMFQALLFTMNLALMANNIGLIWVAAAKTHLGLVAIPFALAGLALAWTARWMPRRTPKGTGMVRRVMGVGETA